MVSSLLLSHVLIPTLLTNWNLYSWLKKKGLRNINSFKISSFKPIRFPHNGFHLVPPRNPIFTPNSIVVVTTRVAHRIQPLCLSFLDRDLSLVLLSSILHLGTPVNLTVRSAINKGTLLILVGIGMILLPLLLLWLTSLNLPSQPVMILLHLF